MIESKDFLGKSFSFNRRVVYISNKTLRRAKVIAINEKGVVKIEDELDKKILIVNDPSTNIYAYPEEIDIKEAFAGFNIIESDDQMTGRDFERQLSVVEDSAGDNILECDKVLMIYNSKLQLGRTRELDKKDKSIYISIPDEMYPIKVNRMYFSFLLINKDYYLKSK